MNIWRWLLGLVSAVALVGACSSGASGDEDDGSGGSGSGSGTTSGTTTGTAVGTASGTATGTTTGASTGTGTGTQGCFRQPDFDGCIDCLCMIDQAGCAAYTQALIDNIICGQTCGGTECADFCMGASDRISATCIGCSNTVTDGNPDVDAFTEQCQASPACASFVTTLKRCPQG